VPGRDQAQQVILPGGKPGNGVAAPLGIQLGLVQMRPDQREQRPVPLGKSGPGSRKKYSRMVRPGPTVHGDPSGRQSCSSCSYSCGR
jgi:hypothetical protein